MNQETIGQLNSDNRLHYLPDNVLYMLWKYLNGRRLVRKNVLTFEDIAPAGMSIASGAAIFLQTLSNLGLELEGVLLRTYMTKSCTSIKNVSKNYLMKCSSITSLTKAITSL